MISRNVYIVIWLWLFTVPIPLMAEEGGMSETPADEAPKKNDTPVFTPPKLVEYIQADYPPKALEAGLEADVLAELEIDENGLVVGVTIKEPAGHGFDEAATDAMYRFAFAPALRDSKPIASKTLYKYKFFLTEVAVEEEVQEALPANLSGVVSDMSGTPVADASMVFVAMAPKETDETSNDEVGVHEVTTDETGKFELKEIEAGSFQVDIVASGFKPLTITEDLVEGETREVIYRLEPEESLYETVVRGKRPPREVTRREITRREITRIPGTGGDALRSIQNLPGMARAPFGGGQLIVRGSAPEDSQYFFDSLTIPLLYHFGGATSIINSDLLETIDFYPGNFGSRYGRATGGIVEVYPRTPATDRLHAYIDADLIDASLLIEGPIGENWSVAASGRRSYIDGILGAVLPESDRFSFDVAPRYYDYQLVADYHPNSKDNLRLFFFGSDDKLVFVFGEDAGANPSFTTSGISFRLLFHQGQLRWKHQFGKGVSNNLNIGTGYQQSDTSLGHMFKFDAQAVPIYLRDEIEYDEKRNIAFRFGIDTILTWAKWEVRAPIEVMGMEGQPQDPLQVNEEIAETKNDDFITEPGFYAEIELRPLEGLRLIGGARFDMYPYISEVSVDPRFVARYQLFKGTTLKGGVGRYSQPPQDFQVDEDFGNPNLHLIHANHYSIGVEQQIIENVEVGLEGFYKDLSNLVVPSLDGQTRYNNDGTGKVWGMELMLKHLDNGRFFGWISYTLMKSQRIDHPGDKERPFDFDQTHILNIVGNVVLGRGWEAGIRFRLVTGNPTTPVIGTLFDADSDIYLPINGPVNSDRLPSFHQLDVRVDKKWTLRRGVQLAIYLDVQNAYNHENPEGYNYSYDYSQRKYFFGLPVIPSLGMKIEY